MAAYMTYPYGDKKYMVKLKDVTSNDGQITTSRRVIGEIVKNPADAKTPLSLTTGPTNCCM